MIFYQWIDISFKRIDISYTGICYSLGNDITRLTRPVQVFDRGPSRKAINIIRVRNGMSISRFRNRQIGYGCSISQAKVSMLSLHGHISCNKMCVNKSIYSSNYSIFESLDLKFIIILYIFIIIKKYKKVWNFSSQINTSKYLFKLWTSNCK